ncbi:hypothetical protein DM02DRAFT_619709 [Periconia macrospinosa]|uniref:Uncharacterized protein n=1 Tax=Periconia macrospinosa TaxID=97972 RepID=A0A2V1D581_9PLEO|nr:hypothetical protein DM02DRAFT_619709 [Periconia macrospinosa]
MATAKDYSKAVLTADGRFFYSARPAFSVCQRNLQEFQFLNNSDPGSKCRHVGECSVCMYCALTSYAVT